VIVPQNKFAVGLGWDTSKKHSIDLDSSISGLDIQKQQRDFVSYHHLQAFGGGVRHQGDNRTGEGKGDDEVIHFDLDKIPPEVQYLVIVVNSFSGVPFTKVKSAYIRLKDLQEKTFAFFRLSNMKESTGLFFGFLYRGNGDYQGKWFFKTTAIPVHGRSLEQSLGIITDNLS
jgi:tellurium resistance protein TerZ